MSKAGLRLRSGLRYDSVGKWASNFACHLVLNDTLSSYGRVL
jgi:hypothetical protein